MKTKLKIKLFLASMLLGCMALSSPAEDITTLDGHTYQNVSNVLLRQNGLFFVYGTGSDMHGVTVAYEFLPPDVKARYHYDPFEMGLAYARQNLPTTLTKGTAFSLDNLEAAKKKAKAEKKDDRFHHGVGQFFCYGPTLGAGKPMWIGAFL